MFAYHFSVICKKWLGSNDYGVIRRARVVEMIVMSTIRLKIIDYVVENHPF